MELMLKTPKDGYSQSFLPYPHARRPVCETPHAQEFPGKEIIETGRHVLNCQTSFLQAEIICNFD